MKQQRLSAIFKLWKDFRFEASHRLTKVPVGHQCGRLHGHSYKVRIHCKGALNPDRDWVVDYGDISKAVSPIIESLDHTFLNDHLDLETTAENLAWWIGQQLIPRLEHLSGVEVFETPTTSVLWEVSIGRV
jgi:6-pyruvoyltetrahydropterin/6-carboxytetrahydropterin synthase